MAIEVQVKIVANFSRKYIYEIHSLSKGQIFMDIDGCVYIVQTVEPPESDEEKRDLDSKLKSIVGLNLQTLESKEFNEKDIIYSNPEVIKFIF